MLDLDKEISVEKKQLHHKFWDVRVLNSETLMKICSFGMNFQIVLKYDALTL